MTDLLVRAIYFEVPQCLLELHPYTVVFILPFLHDLILSSGICSVLFKIFDSPPLNGLPLRFSILWSFLGFFYHNFENWYDLSNPVLKVVKPVSGSEYVFLVYKNEITTGSPQFTPTIEHKISVAK